MILNTSPQKGEEIEGQRGKGLAEKTGKAKFKNGILTLRELHEEKGGLTNARKTAESKKGPPL